MHTMFAEKPTDPFWPVWRKKQRPVAPGIIYCGFSERYWCELNFFERKYDAYRRNAIVRSLLLPEDRSRPVSITMNGAEEIEYELR